MLLAAARSTLAPSVSVGHLLVQMVVALVIVVGGIWLLSKILKMAKLSTRPGRRGSQQALRVLSRQPIGKGTSVAVVEVEGQRFLVGISGSSITPLGELHGDTVTGGEEPSPDPSTRNLDLGSLKAALSSSGSPRRLLDTLREATVRR